MPDAARMAGLTLLVGLLGATAWAGDAPISERRQVELRHLLLQDCGSCHGMTLKGGLGPSLRPQRLKQLPAPMLKTAILDGRPGTPMPPWRGLLTEAEAAWLVERLQSGDWQP